MFSKKGYILLFYIMVRMQGHFLIYKLEKSGGVYGNRNYRR